MHKEFLMGNAAIALGAVAAGVNVVAGYPGTPSTEVLETIAKHRPDDVYVEWSVNEKAAMELAAGASYAGARSMVTMKQVGLNVASDPLMSLEYVGIKGGMVILVADDPGPISSQTEQDTRHFSRFSKLPCFDPSSAQEAYEMIQEAFEYSEKYGTPLFLRPTTRVCHGYASIMVKDETEYTHHQPEGFIKDSKRWVIFPRLSFMNHKKIEARNQELSDIFSSYEKNTIHPSCDAFKDSKKGIATGGISYTYTMETLKKTGMVKTLKIATPHPFPEKLAVDFLSGLDEVLCLEELDPVIERELIYICGKYHLPTRINGKLSGHTACAGENTRDTITTYINTFLGLTSPVTTDFPEPPALPVRPPVLCAGCPHRASFYAVKKVEPDTTCFAFVGDSTFFASAITGVVNAVYNQANMILIVLDNSTTAMTGHQPHPGTGRTVMGEIVQKINIEQVLRGIGVTDVKTVNPLDLNSSVACVREMADKTGVKAIIFKSPCMAITKPEFSLHIDAKKCIGCKKCIRELGCPAIVLDNGNVCIDDTMCTGCGLCSQICPTGAIIGGKKHE